MRRYLVLGGAVILILVLLTAGVAWAAGNGPSPAPDTQGSMPGSGEQLDRELEWLGGRVVRGTVTGVSGDRSTLKTAQGLTVTLAISQSTVLWIPGEPPTHTIKLSAGDPVLALGRPIEGGSGQTTLAARIVVVAGDEELPKVLIRGRAIAVTNETIVVGVGRGERAITVRPRTVLWSGTGRLGSLSDVRPADPIVALGQPTELGQWVAGAVLVPRGIAGAGRSTLRGQVTAVDTAAGTLTVRTVGRGGVTVVVNDQTRYRIKDVTNPGLGDVKVGDQVVVVGRLEKEDGARFVARGIGVVPGR